MTRTRLATILGFVASAAFHSAPAASLTRDWTANVNGASEQWQFFRDVNGPIPVSHFSTYTVDYPSSGLDSWNDGSFQIIGKNTSGSAVDNGVVTWPAEQVFVHPGSIDGVAVGYSVPSTGNYDISGYLQPLHTGDINWILNINSFILAQGNTIDLLRDEFDFANISLTAGDMVYLMIGSANGNAGDTTGIDLVINPSSTAAVPDGGSTGFALAAALGAIVFVRRYSGPPRQSAAIQSNKSS